MKIKTAALTGLALRWAVAQAEGHRVEVVTPADLVERLKRLPCNVSSEMEYIGAKAPVRLVIRDSKGLIEEPCPAYETRWDCAGPIIHRDRIMFEHGGDVAQYCAYFGGKGTAGGVMYGPDHITAALRRVVMEKFGIEVEVPDALVA